MVAELMLSPAIQNLPFPPPQTESRGKLIAFALLPHSRSKLTFNTFINTDYATISGSLKKSLERVRKHKEDKTFSFFSTIRGLIAHTALFSHFTQHSTHDTSLPLNLL